MDERLDDDWIEGGSKVDRGWIEGRSSGKSIGRETVWFAEAIIGADGSSGSELRRGCLEFRGRSREKR